MKLADYLNGMRAATTAEALDAAIQAPYKRSFQGRSWATICKVRIEKGLEICAAHELSRFVPRIEGNMLIVCGERYKVGRGGNAAGVRYAWFHAEQFAREVLTRNGISQRGVSEIWGWVGSYPHRCLELVRKALAGEFPDPPMNTLIYSFTSHAPVKMTVEDNNLDTIDKRATRVCECGGTLFDWGSGWDNPFNFISWHCNACPKVFTEYMTHEKLFEIRNGITRENPSAVPA